MINKVIVKVSLQCCSEFSLTFIMRVPAATTVQKLDVNLPVLAVCVY